eukprot:TRINITY_DN68471_c0_g1_i1.p1 TRINITY_DN68471_c0_g1~~TRINITY_DN68471_c0_g1_i1.p1  ORF type:complete len:165 (-),score=27.17 TRINITY_DN68471_c0_g1_i1:50-544(-)
MSKHRWRSRVAVPSSDAENEQDVFASPLALPGGTDLRSLKHASQSSGTFARSNNTRRFLRQRGEASQFMQLGGDEKFTKGKRNRGASRQDQSSHVCFELNLGCDDADCEKGTEEACRHVATQWVQISRFVAKSFKENAVLLAWKTALEKRGLSMQIWWNHFGFV